jgi:hypothetical protein
MISINKELLEDTINTGVSKCQEEKYLIGTSFHLASIGELQVHVRITKEKDDFLYPEDETKYLEDK